MKAIGSHYAPASVTATCKVETFNGSASIGSNSYTFVVSVPPKSTFTLSKSSVSASGSDANIATISPTYSGYSHKITWSTSGYGSGTVNLASGTTTHSYSVPLTWNNSAPGAENFTVTCVVETFKDTADGSLSLGTNTRTFTANVPASILPTVSAFTAAQVDPSWSLYVKTKSKCLLTPTAAGAYSSTITSYRIVGATQDSGALAYTAGTSWTTGLLMVFGTVTFTVTVTDSRGRTATKIVNITVTDYSPPSISGVTFVRATSGGVVSNTGTYINAKALFTYSAIGSNAITAKVYYRQSGTTTWLPAGGTTITHNTTLTYGAGAINQAYIYETRITLADAFTTVEHLNAVPKAVKVFDLREDRAAFGAFATNTKELYVPADWKLMIGTASAFTTADTIPIANGGTGATTAAAARTALGVPATAHTHVKANITDFPASMPASDVYAWAKASTKPTYTNTEVGAAAEGHTHSYLPLAGGTLTGSITLPGSVVLAKDASYNSLTVTNPNGYIQIGPLNTGTCHLYTDRPSFYFNKGLIVNGTNVSMGAVVASHVHRKHLPKFVLHNSTQINEKVFELEFAQPKNTIMSYKSGQFVFVRFLASEVPDESHPFSISSAPIQGDSLIKIMVKNSGDYTSTIKLLKKGDIAALEGPYGNFMDERTALANTPLVMLAGGIGITPMLSVLRSQMATHPFRKIMLVWTLSFKSDLLMIDELQNMQHTNPNFSYHITFTNELVEAFDYGRISRDYLQCIKVNTLYSEADFFICGPRPMMSAVKSILLDNLVKPDNIHIEEFSF